MVYVQLAVQTADGDCKQSWPKQVTPATEQTPPCPLTEPWCTARRRFTWPPSSTQSSSTAAGALQTTTRLYYLGRWGMMSSLTPYLHAKLAELCVLDLLGDSGQPEAYLVLH